MSAVRARQHRASAPEVRFSNYSIINLTDPERSRRGGRLSGGTLFLSHAVSGVLIVQSAAKEFCFSDPARSRRCRRSRRSHPSPSRRHPESRASVAGQERFPCACRCHLRPDSRSGAGEGSAPLQTRVSRPKSVTLHNDESSDRQNAKSQTIQRRRRVAKLAHPKGERMPKPEGWVAEQKKPSPVGGDTKRSRQRYHLTRSN